MGKFKVYTKTGDAGKTGLIGGTRVPKYHLRLEAYGTIDELNSYVGLIRSFEINDHYKETLLVVQNALFSIGSYLATDESQPGVKKELPVFDEDVVFLEKEMDLMEKELPELVNFVLPGNHPVNGFCHIARTVCRRAERRINQLATEIEISPVLLRYVNRLSDYLFVLSRKVLKDLKIDEIKWKSDL